MQVGKQLEGHPMVRAQEVQEAKVSQRWSSPWRLPGVGAHAALLEGRLPVSLRPSCCLGTKASADLTESPYRCQGGGVSA